MVGHEAVAAGDVQVCRRIKQWSARINLSRQLQTQRVQLRRSSTATSRLKSSCLTGNLFTSRFQARSLMYATNTNRVVFVNKPTQQFYYLTAGRWFSAADLQGPWTYATPDLPPDFAKIPLSSPASAILATVPGT